MSPVNMGVLISGNGTNLQSLIDHINAGNINAKIKVVISNRKNAYGLIRAKNNGIDTAYIDKKIFKDEEEFNRAIMYELKKRDVDLVVLAGYLKILSSKFINEYKNKIINIHPSLIPSFCGKGYYGEKVHKAVLDYGAKVTGATVHFVNEEADAGPIILQRPVMIDESDTVGSLQNKVLKIEHTLLPEAVKLYCEGRITIDGRKVSIKE
ncbi:phosphoribosylglycinamide formyltransferase [Sporanaerobacter sp. PP17-6a]|uniref:phosphoribosylglycinamide formyltransferase n=1 Tax=Sporanaerobacter sp. PP17-6a TaxID=1891289 RepID=UPI00089FF3B5|nr:phosphoribosylglycinamide formyltransferase [Sporanaerobacter sp. PP17-6a]SCL88239.1 Phosphoribosylglycinamide formyltransferase [Sporanaerobacter sp. PP17-6a]